MLWLFIQAVDVMTLALRHFGTGWSIYEDGATPPPAWRVREREERARIYQESLNKDLGSIR